jgi:hypothetical protein
MFTVTDSINFIYSNKPLFNFIHDKQFCHTTTKTNSLHGTTLSQYIEASHADN